MELQITWHFPEILLGLETNVSNVCRRFQPLYATVTGFNWLDVSGAPMNHCPKLVACFSDRRALAELHIGRGAPRLVVHQYFNLHGETVTVKVRATCQPSQKGHLEAATVRLSGTSLRGGPHMPLTCFESITSRGVCEVWV